MRGEIVDARVVVVAEQRGRMPVSATTCSTINPRASLSPLPCWWCWGKRYTKCFTALCHRCSQGLSLALIGVFLAVTGYFSLPGQLLSVMVLCW